MSKILIISDSKTQNERMKLVLKGQGFEVHTGIGGLQGSKMINDHFFDLVIMEVVMKEISGFEIITQIKQQNDTTKIIAMTSGGIIDVHEYLNAVKMFGANMVIKKPFRDGYMIRVVKLILNKYSTNQISA
jgi:DNA-binding NtrC family response regulator